MATVKDNSAREIALEDAKLREFGFDPAAAPADAVARLDELRSVIGIAEAAIVRALAKIPTVESAAMLARMEAQASGPARREIRGALFKLRQRGITPPPSATPSPAAAIGPVAPAEPGLSALLSPIDGDGARVVWIMKARPGAGLRRLWGLVSERDGLFGISLSALTRKELRLERADLERRSGIALIDADWHLADFILSEAYRRTPEASRAEVRNFFAIRNELIAQSPLTELHHPIYDEFAADLAREPSADLMKEPEIAAWTLAPESVKSYADEIASLRNSVIVLNRMQQEERVVTVVERALVELLAGDVGIRLRRHLEDTAYYFARTRRRELAASTAAAAARLRDGADLKRSPFFQAFMRAQLGALIAEEEQHQRQEPRLIMTPAEAMRAQQTPRSRPRMR